MLNPDVGTDSISSGNFMEDETIKSFHHDGGKIIVIVIKHSKISTWPPQPKYAVKRIYEAIDGKIVQTKSIQGKVIPQQTIPEQIEWEE